MSVRSSKQQRLGNSPEVAGKTRQYAWKERTYVVPSPSRKGFQWKVSALLGLERVNRAGMAGRPVTVVIPAVYNLMPAETIALGWLNEIDALVAIRNRIIAASKVTGWDVFTFHTLHNLDPFYASMIGAVRETWLREGSLKAVCITEAERRYGHPYDYNRVEARLVENLVFQSCFIDWLTARAKTTPLRFHVLGTALLAALVSTGALPFERAVSTAVKVGSRWDAGIAESVQADQEAHKGSTNLSAENLGWLQFSRVREILEGRSALTLGASGGDLPEVLAPTRPFLYSARAQERAVLVETADDVRWALGTMNLASWAPGALKALPNECAADRVRGWLISPLHPMASTCRWSVHNYLLATPGSTLLFLEYVASLGRGRQMPEDPETDHNGIPVPRTKVTGP